MKSRELRLLEFAPTRTQFNQILNDDTIKMGFECELITDIEKGSDEEEKDYDEWDWNDVENYCSISRRVQGNIDEAFGEWKWEQSTEIMEREWLDQKDDYVRQYCIDNDYITDDMDDEAKEEACETYEDDARDDWFQDEDNRDAALDDVDGDMDDFIRDSYGGTAAFMMAFEIYDESGSGEGPDEAEAREEVASRLEDIVDEPVYANPSTHSRTTVWYVDEDGSLDDDTYACAEIVSPVFVLRDGIDTLQKIFLWMESENYTTDNSTGLHVSFSIDGKGEDDYDFLKMMVLFDENYTASLFKRLGQYYCAQMRQVLFAQLSSHTVISALPDRQLQQAATNLRRISKTFEGRQQLGTSKYFTFRHRAKGVVEFRSMGNADYEKKFDIIRKRIINMAYLMKVGSDPNFMLREYIERIYRMLTTTKFSDPKLNVPRAAPKVPMMLSAFTTMITRSLDMLWNAEYDPILFVKSVLSNTVGDDGVVRMTQQQVRQLRFYLAKRKVTPEQFRQAAVNDTQYNWLANVVKWPLVVPGYQDDRQQPLPFARQGSDLSGVVETPPHDDEDAFQSDLDPRENPSFHRSLIRN